MKTSFTRRQLFTKGSLMAALGVILAPTSSEALPVHRVARRTSRRTTRRVARRHMYALPVGAAAFSWGAYNYYRYNNMYYYPYMYGGRTVYVEVDIDARGYPLPPPNPSEVDFGY